MRAHVRAAIWRVMDVQIAYGQRLVDFDGENYNHENVTAERALL